MWSMKIELKDDEVEVLAKAAHGNMYVAQFVESMVRGFIAAQQYVQRTGGRLCENCGEPLENHVGGVKRGLCKNPARR